MEEPLSNDLSLPSSPLLTLHFDQSHNCDNVILYDLPSVVISKVLSFLPCKDKLNAVAAFPDWTDHLRTSTAWHWFSSDYDIAMTRPLLRQLHQMSCWSIRHYGRYFQNCSLVLQYLDLSDMGLELLEHVASHCVGLKSFRLYHPDCFTFTDRDAFEKYVTLLHTVFSSCRTLKHVALCNLDYLAMNKRDGIQELFDRFVEDDVHQHINELEFSHAHDYSRPIESLTNFRNLRKLKCPIQVLTTGIVTHLVANSLTDLYVVNDGSTLNEDFNEVTELRWFDIAKTSPFLRVHYTIHGRSFRRENVVPNPLVHTLVVDSLCNSISQDLMTALASAYGESLTAFAHLATAWSHFPYDDNKMVGVMYRDLVCRCPHLRTVATAVEIPSTALLLIAANHKLDNLWVDGDKVQFDFGEVLDVMDILQQASADSVTEYVDWWETLINDLHSLQKLMSRFLAWDWSPLTSEELTEKTKPFVRF